MTILDIPRAVLVNLDRIRYDIDMVRVVTEKVCENGADEWLHPTETRYQISI